MHARTVLPAGFFRPPHTTAVGHPAEVFGPDRPDELAAAIAGVGFTDAVRQPPDDDPSRPAMPACTPGQGCDAHASMPDRHGSSHCSNDREVYQPTTEPVAVTRRPPKLQRLDGETLIAAGGNVA